MPQNYYINGAESVERLQRRNLAQCQRAQAERSIGQKVVKQIMGPGTPTHRRTHTHIQKKISETLTLCFEMSDLAQATFAAQLNAVGQKIIIGH